MAATVVAPTTTQIAIELIVQGLEKGTQPAIRTPIDLRSYPTIEELARKGAMESVARCICLAH